MSLIIWANFSKHLLLLNQTLVNTVFKGAKHPLGLYAKDKETSKTYFHQILAFYDLSFHRYFISKLNSSPQLYFQNVIFLESG